MMPRSLFALLFATSLAACGTSGFEADDTALLDTDDGKADSISTTSTYYVGRQDFRKCASPMCGGTWVRRVNFKWTKCVDGSWQSECYVWNVDVAKLSLDEYLGSVATTGFASGSVVMRGKLALGNAGQYGTFVASEAWMSPEGPAPAGGDTFYRASDTGIRCITSPCPSTHIAKLNSTISTNRAGVDLDKLPFTDQEREEAAADLHSKTGLVVAGTLSRGSNPVLQASQAYRRIRGGGACGQPGDANCGPGLLCCFPCGIQPDPELGGNVCHNQCMVPANGTNHCPLFQ